MGALTVWVLQTGEPLHVDAGDPRPMRAMNLATALVGAGHSVVLWSSAFYHQEKSHRARTAVRIQASERLAIQLIPSPGYSRNVGIGRLWDHAVLALRLRKSLAAEASPPDVGFVGYPPIEAAAVMTRWLAKRGVPCVLDVKDQWPSLIHDAVPGPLKPLAAVGLAPYYGLGRRAMREATGLCSMAEGFLNWGLDFSGRTRTPEDTVAPLTSPRSAVSPGALASARRWWDANEVRIDGRLRVCFVGSLSRAFDFQAVRDAAARLQAQGASAHFVFCGDGERAGEWREAARDLRNVQFAGWVDRSQIEALAERSAAFLAPYHSTNDFCISIPNKVLDALSLGLPLLSPLRGEVAHLISAHDVGLRYGPDVDRTLDGCVEMLVDDPELRGRMSRNARTLFEERFSYEKVYGGLVAHLEGLASRHPRPAWTMDDRARERQR